MVKKENNKKKKSKLETRDKVFILIGCILFIFMVTMTYFEIFKKSNFSAIDISKKLKNRIDTIERYKKVDPDGIAGKKYEYLQKTYIYDTSIKYESDDWLEAPVSVEVFRNDDDAKLRYDYLVEFYNSYNKNITQEEFGEKSIKKAPTNKNLILNGNVLLRINENASDDSINKYKNTINKILKRNRFEKSNYSKDKLVKIKKQKNDKISSIIETTKLQLIDALNNQIEEYEEELNSINDYNFQSIEEKISDFKDISIVADKYNNLISKINEKRQNFINDVNVKIDNLYSSLNRDELKILEDEISVLTDSFYSEYKETWNSKITDIKNKITEKEKQEEIARKTKTLSNGFYTVGTDIEIGTYDLTAVSGGGNLFIYTSSGRLYVNEMMGTGDSRFYSKTYNNISLGYGYTVEIANGVTIKFQAK